MKPISCVVVGDSGVGKTSLLVSYTCNKFPTDYIPTTLDQYAVTVLVEGHPCTLSVFDTGGSARCDHVRWLSYAKADVFIVCFSVLMPSSFDNVRRRWIPEIRSFCDRVPIVVVGTQTDLRVTKFLALPMSARIVSAQCAFRLVKQFNAVAYVECSALTQAGLKVVFDEVIMATVWPTGLNRSPQCSVL